MTSTPQTLSQRLAAGPIPVAEVLDYAMSIAVQLRRLHHRGTVHGALSPSTIAVAGTTVQLLAPAPQAHGFNSYTAPEIAGGATGDARSDIFSFGTILYEMWTGRPLFDAEQVGALQAGLPPAPLRSSGSPALDRLVVGCVSKSPDARFQLAQKLILELRVMMSSVRRGTPLDGKTPVSSEVPVLFDAPASKVVEAAATVDMPAVAPQPLVTPTAPPKIEMIAAPVPAVPAANGFDAVEARITARLEAQERSIASVTEIANEMLKALRVQQAAAPARVFNRPSLAGGTEDLSMSRLERAVDLLNDKLTRMDMVLTSTVERLQRLEQNLDAFDRDSADLRDSVTRDIRNFERVLKSQSSVIESTRTAMGQTDDLVERVVEALDSLQSMYVPSPEARVLAS
jgi:hypothetical protein